MARRIRAREVLRLRSVNGLSQNAIARTAHVSKHSVQDVLEAARERGVSWEDVEGMSEEAAYALLFPGRGDAGPVHADPDWARVHRELARTGVTLKLLHAEYADGCAEAGAPSMSYDRFCKRYRQYTVSRNVVSRVGHKAGRNMEVDWSGPTMRLVDPATGEVRKVYLFVACLPFSRYSYVEPTLDMKQDTWLLCHVHAFSFLGGATPCIVPDNLRTGVTAHPRAGEPVLNAAYEELAAHYGSAVIPARVRRPRDKPSAENEVWAAATYVIAALRDEVFTDIDVPGSYYKDTLRRQAVVNAGLTLNFTDEKEKDPATGKAWYESWCYEHGIADYVAEVAGEDTLTPVFSCESEASGRDREDQPDYKVRMSAAFCFSNKVQMLEYYHNSSWLEHGGSPEHAVRTAFVYQINKYLKEKNLYKKGESAISFQDVQDCLVYVSSSFSTRTSYENQTKKAITNKFVSQAMTDFLKHYLEVYFLEKPDEAQKICQQVLVNKQSREHAEKTRQSIKKTLSTQIDLANRVQKFVDCRTKDASRRELYIVEGDSAMGAVKSSRDSEYQAIMPIRGKILNCLKADYARIFKSDVIVDLIKVMGCGVELGGKHNKELATFNLDNLRFNKIVICTDADVDGYQIRTLVLTMLYRLTPTLIEKGYVYIAESPLYEITTKDRTYFAYTEPEKTAFLEEIGEKKYTIQRSKGLGENDPEMMWLTTMNPESRRLIKVMPTDVVQTAQVFDILLGDNLAGRKEHIAQHGAEYLDDLDVS